MRKFKFKMKHIFLLLNIFFISIAYSQQKENLNDVPTYFNCDINQSPEEKLKEIKTKSIEHIITNLDSISIKQLKLPSETNFKLLINYTIDETGFIKPIFTNVTSGYDFFDQITEKIINIIPRFNTSQNESKKSYNLFFLANLEIKNNKITSFSFTAPFDDPEIVPSFAGCQNETKRIECFQEKMSNHIKKTQQYPKKALRKDIMGRVETFFIIDKDGTIKNIKVKQVEGKELLEEEAIRIISLLPKIIVPGKINGIPIKIKYMQPITFKIQ